MKRWLEGLQPTATMLLRVVLGLSMVYWGWDKMIPARGAAALSALNHNAQFVHSLGLPAWLGYVSAVTEFVGGACLVIGLLTRFWAVLVTINMLFAICLVGIHQAGWMQKLQFPSCLTVMALLIATIGPGVLALDRRLGLD